MPARPLILGHRGLPGAAPENTLPSLQAALDAGCDGVEIDVRLAVGGQPVLSHDPPPGGGEACPSLADALALVGAAVCAVEIKGRGEEAARAARAACKVLLAEAAPGPRWILAFDPAALLAARDAAPGLGRVLNVKRRADASVAEACGATVVDLERRGVEEAQVAALRRAGLGVWAWVVDDGAEASRFAAPPLSLDALITEDPVALRAALVSAS